MKAKIKLAVDNTMIVTGISMSIHNGNKMLTNDYTGQAIDITTEEDHHYWSWMTPYNALNELYDIFEANDEEALVVWKMRYG